MLWRALWRWSAPPPRRSSPPLAPTINVRGVIAAVSGTAITVKAREGKDVTVDVPDGVNISTTKPFSMAEVKPGQMLAVTTVKRADGATMAIDVRPLPPTANTSQSPYDLQPQSTMNNVGLEAAVEASGGQEMTLKAPSGPIKVLVTKDTAMSQSVPGGTRADLKVGETVFLVARIDADKFTATRVQVSKDGVKPTQ